MILLFVLALVVADLPATAIIPISEGGDHDHARRNDVGHDGRHIKLDQLASHQDRGTRPAPRPSRPPAGVRRVVDLRVRCVDPGVLGGHDRLGLRAGHRRVGLVARLFAGPLRQLGRLLERGAALRVHGHPPVGQLLHGRLARRAVPDLDRGVVLFAVSIGTSFTGFLAQTNFDAQWIAGQAKDGLENSVGVGAWSMCSTRDRC